ncbi:MAG: nucleoside 2-deoxyribosyltransferase [Candidatus Andersenbacteria bacterium]
MSKWFISHPSGGHRHTPIFFNALEQFAAEEKGRVELIHPREKKEELHITKQDIASCDLVIAEVSIASTGSGIELGWANAAGKEVIAFYEGAEEASPAIQFVTKAIHPYITEEHIILILKQLL